MSGIGIIGGSGLYQIDEVETVTTHNVETPFGEPSDPIIEASVDSVPFYFLSRHGAGHRLIPSEVNYRANLYALKKIGVEKVVSISAVGSLKESLHPGMFFVPDQFIDWTKGRRERSFFGEGMVGHVSGAEPVDKNLKKSVETVLQDASIDFQSNGSYLCIEGPQFSSRAESQIYRSFGCSVIGMTNIPECYLALEAGIAYTSVCTITDYDAWKEEACSLKEILKVMSENTIKAQSLIKRLIPYLDSNDFKVNKENQYCVVTDESRLSDKHREILKVLQR
jgi:5'-methylthioadenosine phosphorylase